MNRWHAFLLYFEYAANEIKYQKPIGVFKMVIEFAFEYRTNRDKILQMRNRVAEKRERNKTRGMMIGVAQKQQQRKCAGDDTLNRRRGQQTSERSLIAAQTQVLRGSPGDNESADDELLDGVVRTVTTQADTMRNVERRHTQGLVDHT